eukprot:Plantae.Rhodophyta-Hildenbrandia_rubra.ctg10058.p1 GENE.Plantae.Rhodophyta-Hildenbrandia_rubra.ctg10058~~Plantae.Rhodophyta-Hildenbrandia_rubra.ctg10058.p1  ORF type:complete len:738 (+),score=122.87 Plantae.Rhodophyta-Hildenbrandia_rubra.ctg10058:108-2216(+)
MCSAFLPPASLRNVRNSQRTNDKTSLQPKKPWPQSRPVRRRPHARLHTSNNDVAPGNGDDRNGVMKKSDGFVVWGPPGCGKTTLCEAIARKYGLVRVGVGDLLRAHVLYRTKLGVQASEYVEKERPVPDAIVIPMVIERLAKSDCMARGFILDAYPRSMEQDVALKAAGFGYKQAFIMHAPRTVLESRLQNRRVDPETRDIYNVETRLPASQEVLERLTVLSKDESRNVDDLLAMYGRHAADMFEKLQPKAVSIDADRSVKDIVAQVSQTLEANGYVEGKHIRKEKGEKMGSGIEGPLVAVPHAPYKKKASITLIRCDGYMCERESVVGSSIGFRGAATEQVMLVWNQRPSTVFLLARKGPELMPSVLEAARYLMEKEKVRVVVEPHVQTEALANGLYLHSFSSKETLYNEVDLVVCLGGDGLILHASTLFDTAVPPVVSFNLGSLGFLTPFDFKDFQSEMSAFVNGNCLLSLRMRLTCAILRNGEVFKEFNVLNEVVIDRGASPYLSNLDCFCDDKYITTVQADGIIMSTPTGSTAYSMSAGGSMVHPSVPAILFTPICPHSLSFRPIVFPDAAKIRIDIAYDARSHAWASFDGKYRQQLRRGDGLLVQMSLYPVPTVNKTDHTGDWFQSLDRAFNFNSRAKQKPLGHPGDPRPIDLDDKLKNSISEGATQGDMSSLRMGLPGSPAVSEIESSSSDLETVI